MKKLPLAVLLLTLYAGISGCNDRPDRQSLQNIEAFARMYGLVRRFHPSDEAQRVDWNRFALYGVERVAACESTEELERELERLFRPLAPGIGFSDHGRDEGLPARITPPDTSGRQVVAWQHKGVDTETAVFLDGQIFNGDYISKRTNRPLEYRNDKRLVLFGQLFPAADYGDHEIKVRARIRKNAPSDDLRLSFKVATRPQWRDVVPFGPDADRWLVQNDGQWETYERSLSVAAENRGEAIRWGIYADGEGSFSVGAIEMENLKTGKKSPSPVYESRSYRYRTDSSGRYDIRVYDLLPARMQLFEGHASCGEYRSERLTEGLYAHVPLALYDTRSGTYPSGDPETLEDLLRATESAAPSDRAKMYADLIVAWNAIKYFGPYLAEMRLDWDEELRKALSRASRCKRYDLKPLRLMMAQIEDAHVHYVEPAASQVRERFLPLQVRKMERLIVVTDSKDSSLRYRSDGRRSGCDGRFPPLRGDDLRRSSLQSMDGCKRMAVPSGAGSDYARNRARRPPADDYDALPENARVRRMAPVAAAAAAEPVDRRSHALSESGLYRTRRGKRSVEKPAAGTDGNRGYAQRYRISVSRPDRPALPRRPPVFPTGDFAGSLPHASRNSRAERHAAGHRASGTEPEKHFPDRSLQPEPPRKRAGLRPLCRAGLSRRNEHRRLHRSHKLSPVAIGI